MQSCSLGCAECWPPDHAGTGISRVVRSDPGISANPAECWLLFPGRVETAASPLRDLKVELISAVGGLFLTRGPENALLFWRLESWNTWRVLWNKNVGDNCCFKKYSHACTDFSSSLELPTSKRFAFFFLGGPAILFLSLYYSGPPAGLWRPWASLPGRDAQGRCGANLLTWAFLFSTSVSHPRSCVSLPPCL